MRWLNIPCTFVLSVLGYTELLEVCGDYRMSMGLTIFCYLSYIKVVVA